MGGYTNISERKTRVRAWGHFLRLTLVAVLSLSATPSLADSPAALAPTHEVAPIPNPTPHSVEAQSVSSATHPAVSTTSHAAAHTASAPAITPRPLTRAAAQLHIDEMSPVDWLSQFGSVSIGQRH